MTDFDMTAFRNSEKCLEQVSCKWIRGDFFWIGRAGGSFHICADKILRIIII